MARIIYDGIELQIVHTNEISRESVYSEDGIDYLYTKWIIDVICQFNPGATSYNQPGISGGNLNTLRPTPQFGNTPAWTDISIRHVLSQPRKALMVISGNLFVLRSPATGLTTGSIPILPDAAQGPFPRVFDVKQLHGDRTWAVHFRVETAVNECPQNSDVTESQAATQRVILSHRWKKYLTTDDDYLATVVTEGTAVFRSDVLADLGTFPDNYRLQLFAQVPPNFQRGPIHVIPESDGVTFHYQTTDTEKAFNTGTGCPATRIEAYQTSGFVDNQSLARRIANYALSEGTEFMGAGLEGPFGLSISRTAVLGIGRALIGLYLGIPVLNYHVECRAWGNRNQDRNNLTAL
jgi:hypothetical protein